MARSVLLNDENTIQVHDAGEALSDHIVREQDYFEREILDYLETNHKKQKTILDVGANIGNHTLFFATHLDYQAIIAFEPILDNYNLLKENTDNFFGIKLRNVAVGDSTKEVKMTINRGNMGACEVDPYGNVRAHQVRIDDLFVSVVSLIKVDVEWSEIHVLEGGKNLIREDKPLILIEDSNFSYTDYLQRLGYEIEASWPQHKTYLYTWRTNA